MGSVLGEDSELGPLVQALGLSSDISDAEHGGGGAPLGGHLGDHVVEGGPPGGEEAVPRAGGSPEGREEEPPPAGPPPPFLLDEALDVHGALRLPGGRRPRPEAAPHEHGVLPGAKGAPARPPLAPFRPVHVELRERHPRLKHHPNN